VCACDRKREANGSEHRHGVIEGLSRRHFITEVRLSRKTLAGVDTLS